MKVLLGVFENQNFDSREVVKFEFFQVTTQPPDGLHIEHKRRHSCMLAVFQALTKLRNLSDEGYERFNLMQGKFVERVLLDIGCTEKKRMIVAEHVF